MTSRMPRGYLPRPERSSGEASAGRRRGEAHPREAGDGTLTLAGLVALLRLVDDVDAALAAHDLVVAVAPAQRLQRIADLHRSDLRRVTVVEDRPIANEKRTGRGTTRTRPAHLPRGAPFMRKAAEMQHSSRAWCCPS